MPDLELQTFKIVEIMKEAENLNNAETQALNIPVVSKSVCRYYGTNDCKDFQPYKSILYGLCKSENWCTYKDKPNKDDIVESEL